MTDSPQAPAFDRRRALLAGLVGLAPHVVAVAVGLLAAKLTSATDGMRDLGNGVLGLLLTELVLGSACLVTGAVLFARGKRDVGFGLQLGWLVGLVLVVGYIKLA